MPFCVCTLTACWFFCNIFVKLEHFILFSYFDKYHNFIYLHDKHKINGSEAVHIKRIPIRLTFHMKAVIMYA